MNTRKIVFILICFILFIAFIVFTVTSANRNSNQITRNICAFLDKSKLYHVVKNKQKPHRNHYIEEITLNSIINDSQMIIGPSDFYINGNIYDIVNIGDTIMKDKFGEIVVIHKKNKSDTFRYYRCNKMIILKE